MQIVPFVFLGIILLIALVFVAVFASYFRLWLQCFLNRAGIQFPQLILMRLRKAPVRQICELRIKLVQNGIAVSAADLERAYLRGADIEKLAETMLHARQTDRDITWEQLVETELQSA